jgi:hypothetical protein
VEGFNYGVEGLMTGIHLHHNRKSSTELYIYGDAVKIEIHPLYEWKI